MDYDDWKIIILSFVAVIAVISGIVLATQWCHITFVDNVPSVVKVDGKIVYEGSSAGFDLESSGANTTVTINGGFLYFFPRAYYTSKNVEVAGKK